MSTLRPILVSNSESGVCGSISSTEINSLETRIGSFESMPIASILFILSNRLLSDHAQFKLLVLTSKSINSRRELRVLMVGSLALMVLNCLQESASSHSNIFVLDRYHLIEINRLPLIFNLWLLVLKPHIPRSERFKMVPCAQLIVQYFELVLDLCVIRTRAWIRSQFFGDLV